MRSIIIDTLIPSRLDAARNNATKFNYTIKDPTPGMSATEYLFQAESAAEAAWIAYHLRSP